MTNQRPNPNEAFPNPNIPSLCYIKNVVKNPRIIIGDYTYYDDVDGAELFEKHVTHFYDFIGDKLIIGKFCAIAKGVMRLNLTKPGTKAVTTAVEPSTWLFPRNGLTSPTTNSLNVSSHLPLRNIMASPLMT